MDDDLISRIYEAAVLAEKWPDVLTDLGRIAECPAAIFFASDSTAAGGWIGNGPMQDKMPRFVQSGWIARNEIGRRWTTSGEPRFFGDLELFTEEEIARQPIYQEFLKPEGLFWGVGTRIAGPTSNVVAISLRRDYALGPVRSEQIDHLTRLRPELARATFLSARLQLERARAAVAAMNDIGLPAAALSDAGRLRAGNELLGALVPKVLTDQRDRVRFVSKDADAVFSAFLDSQSGKGVSLPVHDSESGNRYLAHVLPIEGAARDIFAVAQWLLIVIPVDLGSTVQASLIAGLFDLTPSEARVAKELLGGASPSQIAERLKVSRETINTHLDRLYVKTGTRRQAQLVALLSRSTIVDPRSE